MSYETYLHKLYSIQQSQPYEVTSYETELHMVTFYISTAHEARRYEICLQVTRSKNVDNKALEEHKTSFPHDKSHEKLGG